MIHLKGQTILEILVATSVVAVLLVGLLSLGNHSLKSSTYAKNLNQATEFSNQLADWFRNIKHEIGWGAFKEILEEDASGTTLTYCFNNIPATTTEFRNLENASCVTDSYIPNTRFWREANIDLSSINDGSIIININTYWQNNITHQTNVQIKLTQWN